MNLKKRKLIRRKISIIYKQALKIFVLGRRENNEESETEAGKNDEKKCNEDSNKVKKRKDG